MNGYLTDTSGIINGLAQGAGQFETAYSKATKPGDSGAAVSTQVGSTAYVVGLHNGLGPSNVGLDSFINPKIYRAATGALPPNSPDISNLPPDLVYGTDQGEVIVGTQRRADMITNGDNDVVAAGTRDDVINTGIGNNDVIFTPSALGESDPGTTIVASPGVENVVGGGANDRLIIPTDRTTSSGSTSDNSDFFTLTGGAFAGTQDGIHRGQLATDGSSADEASFDCDAYSASYSLCTNDAGGNDLQVDLSSGDWSSTVVLKDFHDGDYGLEFDGIGTDTSGNPGIDSPDFFAWLQS